MPSRFEASFSGSLRKILQRYEVQAHRAYQRAVDHFVVNLNKTLIDNTPVWEGTTLRNWRWAVGHADLSAPHDPAGGSIPPGHTNSMALGSEPRRGANEMAELTDFASFLSQLHARHGEPINIYLTNTADSAVPMEYGSVPTKSQSRRPRGVLLLAVLETLTAMGAR